MDPQARLREGQRTGRPAAARWIRHQNPPELPLPFVTRYSEMQKEREFFDILRCASGELHPQALRAAETMAHQMAFDIATGPQQDLKKFRSISRWVMHVQDEQLSGFKR